MKSRRNMTTKTRKIAFMSSGRPRFGVLCGFLVSQVLVMALPASTWGQFISGPFRCLDLVSATGEDMFGRPVTFVGQGQVDGVENMGNLIFSTFQMTASGTELGLLTLTLNPGQASTGVIFFDGAAFINTNRFFWKITTDIPDISLVSNDPVVLKATISSFPPTAKYQMIGDGVDFYVEGDPQQDTVFTMLSAIVDVRPAPAVVPAVSEWGLGVLALLLLSAIAIKFGRRRAAG